MSRRALAIVLSLALAAPSVQGQAPREWTLTGKLIGPDSLPVAGASVRATQGPRTLLARSNDQGIYRIPEMGEGMWTVAVRGLGFVAVAERLTFDPRGMQRDFQLTRTPTQLDPVLVAARWTGVRGIVGDIRLLRPLDGAKVSVIGGGDAELSTDAEGRFAVPAAPGSEVLLHVERAGYARRLVTATVPADGYIELDVPLDTLRDPKRDWMQVEDLERRLKFATPRATVVGHDEIQRVGSDRLEVALVESGTLARKGIMVGANTCLFVNGVARPGFPLASVPASEVEFVEVYPAGSDLSNTLNIRWPPRGECGSGGATVRAAGNSAIAGSRGRNANPHTAQYVVVWTRAQ